MSPTGLRPVGGHDSHVHMSDEYQRTGKGHKRSDSPPGAADGITRSPTCRPASAKPHLHLAGDQGR